MSRDRIAACLLLGLLAISPLGAQETQKKADEKPSEKALSPAEQFQNAVRDYQREMQKISILYRKATTDEERDEILEKRPKPQAYAERVLEVAENNREDPVALDALLWVLTQCRYGPEADQAVKMLIKDHLEDPKLRGLYSSLGYSPSPATEKLLRGVLDAHPDKEIAAQACFSLAQCLKGEADLMDQLESDPNATKTYQRAFGAEYVEHLKQSDPADLVAEAEEYFQRVVDDYADVRGVQGALGELAESALFELRNLAVGKVAPDVEGEDLDGETFHLSDYRGKVVLLDFWGNW